jgi:hypothetical protein
MQSNAKGFCTANQRTDFSELHSDVMGDVWSVIGELRIRNKRLFG